MVGCACRHAMGCKDCCFTGCTGASVEGCQRAVLPHSRARREPELAAAACCMQLQRQFAGPEGLHCPCQELQSLPPNLMSQHAARRSLQLKPLLLKKSFCSPTCVHLKSLLCLLLSGKQAAQSMALSTPSRKQLLISGVPVSDCSRTSNHAAHL